MFPFSATRPCRSAALSLTLALAALPVTSLALTDLADVPLASSSSTQVKPNILFVLDDSGSMDWTWMPDGVSSNAIGYRNHLCNTVYYNPAVNYLIPKDSAGTDLNSASQTSFTSAYVEGFNTYMSSGSTTRNNLSTSFSADGSESSRAAYYWTYAATSLGTPTPDAGLCNYSTSSVTSATTGICCSSPSVSSSTCTSAEYPTSSPPTCGTGKTLVWQKTQVGATSGPGSSDERQNFANWYSYYRSRMKMMKSAAGRAMAQLNDSYRIGFMTIHPGTVDSNGAANGSSVSASKFLKVADFDTTQRANWYSKLYSQDGNSATPLRTALSVAGRYFTGKNDLINKGMVPAQTDDPIQYSCQQNFAIFTTDGYWNSGDGRQVNGSTLMNNQDGVLSELDAYNPSGSKIAVSPRPIYDGAASQYVWNSASNQYRYASCTYNQPQQKTVQWQSRPLGLEERTASLQERTSSLQERIWTLQARTSTLQTRTSSNSGSTWSSWSNTSSCAPDTSNPSLRECRYTDWTAWNNTSSCSPANQDTSGTWSVGTARQCQYALTSDWTNTTSCTPVSQDTSGTWSTGTARDCQYTDWTAWSNTGSCDAVNQDTSGTWSVGTARQCQYSDWSAWSGTGSCTAIAKDSSDPYSVGTARECQTAYGPWTNTGGTCVPSATQECQTVDLTAWANVGSCTPSVVDGSGQQTVCQTVPDATGQKIQYQSTTTSTTYPGPSQSGSIISGPTSSVGSWTDQTGTCYPAASVPALPNPNPQIVTGSGPPALPAGCSAWPCETATTSGGTSNTLADVAQHYYKTDLRTSGLGNCTGALGGTVSVCDNNVPSSGTGAEADTANWQHLTTFTMGLGLSGTLTYRSDYKTATSGDYYDIKQGTRNWPTPSADDPTALDDLWHGAVNGRGQYFSARDPDSVVDALTSALAGINARVASAAAAATSNLEPVAGDNFAYTAKYVTQKWEGDLEAHEIDLTTGEVTSTIIWSAQTKLDAKAKSACDNRTIKLFRSGATNNLTDFTWNTYACDSSGSPTGSASTGLNAGEQANFGTSQVSLFSQYPSMTDGTAGTVDQRSAAAGANLVNYLRGQSGKEIVDSFTANDLSELYRSRDHVMGDIINAQPVYVKAPFAEYDDSGYTTFKTNQAGRTPLVFTAANDGMLHAFHAGTSIVDSQGGEEAWAFIPTMVLPNMYKLATENYASQHTYMVDGTPSVGDIFDTTVTGCDSSPAQPENCWKTILVGGLNKGGKGYYALDITDPASPKGLWEFKWSSTCYDAASIATWYSDCHVGYTFNNPIISKLADGRWVVFVTSGYNNVNAPAVAGDGQGYLYVLEAATGKILYKISTGAGSSASPSGLNHINGWVSNGLRNNTVDRIYGVDLLGNIWRFDVNNSYLPAGREATLVAQAVDGTGTPQPITTRPELAEVGGEPFVYVGTGRYLGSTDSSNTQTQTIWSIKDPLSTTAVTSLRSTLNPITIENQGSGLTATRAVSAATECSSPDGWYADLPDSGERVNVDIKLQLGTLIAASNVPQNNACNIGGYAWLNYFNYATGCAVANSTGGQIGQRLVKAGGTESLAVGITVVRLPSGKTVVIATTSGAEQITVAAPFDVAPPVGKRVSWREIIQ
ncbi:pilus assembly protein [Denitratisoma oestradiolicum]|uniref:PilY1 beta-propeller domain-containing protein n=1 Tax=Denitratisoma oestradiolicum TaxID=311182 RepID=A0A6S6XTG0_9PROT|nr:PilC/PilY family type IV pilus protein [Denitratisoma oestradiolicum]CAB1368040.1 conserved exported protein of unknown function [Denitratisoma oestradiolicum]